MASDLPDQLVRVCEATRATSLAFVLCLRALIAFGYPVTEEVCVHE